jgi:hypothetical protein
MKSQSWLRGLPPALAPTLKKSRPSPSRTRDNRYRPSVERLEDRTLMAYDLGSAFALGSTGFENAQRVATDAAGNVLVAGNFNSASLDLDPGPGTYLLPNAGGTDGFVAKYDPAGNLLWGVQLASSASNTAPDVAVDGAGNVLIVSNFTGSIDIGVPGGPPVTLTNGGSNEGFVAKIDPAGNALWARTVGAPADARLAYGITADAAGNVYATGSEGDRLFVAKYSPAGAEAWTKVVSEGTGKIFISGTTSYAYGTDVAVDAGGNVHVTGSYRGTIDFNSDPKKANSLTSAGSKQNPSRDAFVLKLNATGAYVWAGSMGGQDDDFGNRVALDGSGNVHVSGTYGVDPKADFDPGRGTLTMPAGSGGTFLVKLDPDRNLIWGHRVVGGRDMALDAAGNVYITGPFSGTIDADPGPGTFNLTAGGTGDVLVSKLNSSGDFVWAADILVGGTGSNGFGSSSGIAVDGSGNIYTTGYFARTVDFDPGAGTYSLTSTPDSSGNPSMDAFVSKLVPSSSAPSTAVATDAALMLFLTDDLLLPNKRK